MNTFRKNICLLFTVVLSVLMVSCGGDKFVIEGVLTDMDTKNVRVIYSTLDGIESEWVAVAGGKLKVEGNAPEPTIANIFDQQHKLIAHFLVENGDKVQFKGAAASPYNLEVKGSSANEDWYEFINNNSKLFTAGNSSMIDVAIEKYIRENKGNIVSTLLLMNDYSNMSDEKAVGKLLATIDEDAKPESLLRYYNAVVKEMNEDSSNGRLHPIMVYTLGDSLTTLSPTHSRCNVFYFWSADDANNSKDMEQLKQFATEYKDKKRLQVADVTLDNDTVRWRSRVKDFDVNWKHYWAVGGVVNNSINDLNIRRTPMIIVTDSLGKQLYRGRAVNGAINAAKVKLK